MKIIACEQGSAEWHAKRRECVTGTKLEDVMGTSDKQKSLICCLIAEAGTEQTKQSKTSSEMERGTAEEPFARKAFEKKFKKKVQTVGICVSDKFPWLAHSPDGLITDKAGKYSEGLEIKNPDSATMVSYRMEGAKYNNRGLDAIPTKKYKWQVVDAFLVNEDLKKLYFVVYDARFIEDDQKMYVITVERSDEALQQAIKDAGTRLRDFRAEWVRCKEIILPSNF